MSSLNPFATSAVPPPQHEAPGTSLTPASVRSRLFGKIPAVKPTTPAATEEVIVFAGFRVVDPKHSHFSSAAAAAEEPRNTLLEPEPQAAKVVAVDAEFQQSKLDELLSYLNVIGLEKSLEVLAKRHKKFVETKGEEAERRIEIILDSKVIEEEIKRAQKLKEEDRSEWEYFLERLDRTRAEVVETIKDLKKVDDFFVRDTTANQQSIE